MSTPAFLFINHSGDFQAFQERIEAEGRDCFGWYDPEASKGRNDSGKGMIHRVQTLGEVLWEFRRHKDQLILLIDGNGVGQEMSRLREEGWPVVGSSGFSDRMEHDRAEGRKLAESIGLALPPTRVFRNWAETHRFLAALQEKDPAHRLVFKGEGEDAAGSQLTRICRDMASAVQFAQWVESDVNKKGYRLEAWELQEYVPGVEADWSAWWSGKAFLDNCCLTFEQKKIAGLGMAFGCTDCVLTFLDPAKVPYFQKHLRRLAKPLAKNPMPNCWAANNIHPQGGGTPCFLEWTPRFGWDAAFGEMAILQDAGRPLSEFFEWLAKGQPFPEGYFPRNRWAACIRLFSEAAGLPGEETKGKPVWWDKRVSKNLWWYSLCKPEDSVAHEAADNPLGVATWVAASPEEAGKHLLQMLEEDRGLVDIPDLFHQPRGFAFSKAGASLNQLRKDGWLS